MADFFGPKDSPEPPSRRGKPCGFVSLRLLALLSALGAYLLFCTTSQGVDLRDDSFNYFTGAEGLVAGANYARVGA